MYNFPCQVCQGEGQLCCRCTYPSIPSAPEESDEAVKVAICAAMVSAAVEAAEEALKDNDYQLLVRDQ